MSKSKAYRAAQRALADLKGAIHETLALCQDGGMTNAEIGRALGIYAGHVGHEGHVSRTLLAMMESDGTVEQDGDSKRWKLK
jgi:DNA-binding IclR family transcriptional regulator